MKRIFAFMFFALMGVAVLHAQNVSDFMSRYERVVKDIEAINSKNYEQEDLEKIQERYDKLTDEVSEVKRKMKDEEMEKYYKLKARYQKKLATLKAKRGAKKVIGWAKGVLGK